MKTMAVRFSLFGALFLTAFLLCAGPIRGAIQTNAITEAGVVTSGWAVVFNDAEVSGVTFTGNPELGSVRYN